MEYGLDLYLITGLDWIRKRLWVDILGSTIYYLHDLGEVAESLQALVFHLKWGRIITNVKGCTFK